MTLRELLINIAVKTNTGDIKKTDAALNSVKNTATGLLRVLGSVAGVLGIAFSVREIYQTADAFTRLSGRIGLVTKNVQETNRVMEKLFSVAYTGGSDPEPLMDLFATAGLSLNKIGFSNDDILAFTETMTQLTYIAGLDAQTNASLFRNLNQALGAGTFKGKDFSDIRNIGGAPILEEIAKGLNMTMAQFQEAATKGTIASKDIILGLKNISEETRKRYNDLPYTVGGAFNRIRTAWKELIWNWQRDSGNFTVVAHAINKVADGLLYLAKNADEVRTAVKLLAIAVGSLGAAMLGLKIASFLQYHGGLIWLITNLTTVIGVLKLTILSTAKAMAVALLPFIKLIAVAAIIAGIVLLLEDMYHWIQGNGSILGDYFGEWDKFKKRVADHFSELKTLAVDTFNFILNVIKNFISSIPVIRLAFEVGDMIDKKLGISDKLAAVYNPKSPGQGVPGNQTVNIQNNANVTVQSRNDNPASNGEAAASGVEDAFDNINDNQIVDA